MDRDAQLVMLARSIRDHLGRVVSVLEELNADGREATYPRALERGFRGIEHDARALGLDRLAEFAMHAKKVGVALYDLGVETAVELLNLAADELRRVADDLAEGRRHRLDAGLLRRLRTSAARAGPARGPKQR